MALHGVEFAMGAVEVKYPRQAGVDRKASDSIHGFTLIGSLAYEEPK